MATTPLRRNLVQHRLRDRQSLLGNVLLDSLGEEAWRAMSVDCREMAWPRNAVMAETGKDLDFVYFPTTALVSLSAETLDGEAVNVSLVGNDSAVGLLESCCSRRLYGRAVVQVAGNAWRMPSSAFRRLLQVCLDFRRMVCGHIEQTMVEARQSVACAALHTVDRRLARLLLEVHDKTPGETLPLTQSALSELLGVQRTTVASAMALLQRQGLVKTGHGALTLLNVSGLKAASCSCRRSLAYLRADIQSRCDGVGFV